MKHYKHLAWMMAIAIASMTMTACSLDGDGPEKPIVIIDPVEKATLYACGISPSETRTAGDAQNMLFTEKDIEWFNASTREIKFRDSDIPIYKRLEPFHEIKFYLGDNALFVVSSFVADWDSRIFTDLVLHYDLISDPNQGHYYLHDCYPAQFIDTNEVKANIKKNAGQWELFTYYLESKGKLRK
jgi:hypothetical protein